MAHEGNHICLHRFSFIYVMDDLWEDAYICPIYTVNRTTKSAIYVMELPVMGWVPIKKGGRLKAVIFNILWFANPKRAHLPEFHLWVLPLVFWIDGFSQSGYCMPHSLGLIKNRTDLFSGFWERPVLRKQTLRFQKTMSIGFWNHDGCFLSTAASDNKRKRSWKQTVLFFIFLYTLLACNTT